MNAALTGPEAEAKKMMLMIRNQVHAAILLVGHAITLVWQCFTGSQATTLTIKKFREKVVSGLLDIRYLLPGCCVLLVCYYLLVVR